MATNVLYYGGSFNPIHHGHLLCSRAVAERRGFEKVVLVPSAQPPHKQAGTALADASDRVNMCQLATAGVETFEIDSLELGRNGPSYTIDTARLLKRSTGQRISWLIGADMLQSLPTWHEPHALLEEVDFVVMARPGWDMDWDRLPAEFRRLREQVVTAPLIDIAARDIRERVAAGKSIDYLTPPAVVDYIRKRNLYRA